MFVVLSVIGRALDDTEKMVSICCVSWNYLGCKGVGIRDIS